MIPPRPPPGEQLSAGHIRVDAARAIQKLRAYQLADRAAWALEVVRAAVAAGATSIAVAADADDVWLAWSGPPLPLADLPHLFDELVSPEAAADRQHVRLLAAGVNSALGLDPWFADVYALPGGRVRYTPDSYADDGLRALAVDAGATPVQAGVAVPREGMVVHVRRRGALAAAARFLAGTEARELALIRAQCRDVPVPLALGDARLHRDAPERDIVRVPLGDGLDGFVAIVEASALAPADAVRPGAHGAVLELAERGVVLARLPFDTVAARGPIPIRVYVDAPRLPTDASRSHVRADVHPVTTALRRAHECLPALLAALVAAAAGEGPAAARARAVAIDLLASTLRGAGLRWQLPEPPFDVLAHAPLLRDAAGVSRPATHPWACIHTGDALVDPEHAAWVGDVLWMPSEPLALQLLGGAALDKAATKQHLRRAKRMAAQRDRFFAHAPREPRVEPRRPARTHYAIGPAGRFASAVPDRVFAGLRGHIAVYVDDHPSQEPSEVVLLLQGRELERVPLASTIAFDAAIDAPDLVPGDRYRSALRDAAFHRALAAVRGAAVRAVEQVARELRPGDASLVRRGLAMSLVLGDVAAAAAGPLVDAPVWECTDGRTRSLAELRAHRTIGTAPAGATRVRPAGRPVICTDGLDEPGALARLCPDTAVVRYADDTPAATPAALARVLGSPPCALVIEDLAPPGTTAIIVPSPAPRRVLCHRGVALAIDDYHPTLVPCAIAIDADAIVPGAAWTAVADDAGQRAHPFPAWEQALVRALFAAMVGERPANLVGDPVDFGSPIADLACAALAAAPLALALPTAVVAKLRTLPVIEVLGDPIPRALAELADRLGDDVPVVPPGTAPVAGAFAIVAPLARARAIAWLVGRRLRDATPELARHRARAARLAALADHRMHPAERAALPAGRFAVPLAVTLATPAEPARGVGEVGLGERGTTIRVLCEGRFLTTIREPGWPLDAVVDVPETAIDDAFATLAPSALDAVRDAVTEAGLALLAALAARAPEQLVAEGLPLLEAWCAGFETLAAPVRDAIVAAPAFPTVQGDRVSIAEATSPAGVVTLATWDQPWLARAADEPESAYDRPILRTGSRALHGVIERLHGGPLDDVSGELKLVQHQRRIAQGLVRTPELAGTAPAWKCKLAALGPAGAALGHGEIALALDPGGSVQIYANGEVLQTAPLRMWPRVDLALELRGPAVALGAEGLAALEARVQALAPSLLWKLLPGIPAPWPSGLARSIFGAAAGGAIDRGPHAALPVAELADGSVVPLGELDAQLALYGNAWAVTTAAAAERARPLADRRRVFRTSTEVLERANAAGVALIDATEELALDARAWANRALPTRPFALPVPTLARVELPGDGITESRILVGLLEPTDAARAQIWAQRDGAPFQPRALACAWPTVAVVDDPRFVPDRTWDHAVIDATWERALARIEAASARLHDRLAGDAPGTALVALRVDADLIARCDLRAPVAIAGTLWLDRAPARREPIAVRGRPELVDFSPAVPVRANLVPFGADATAIERVGAVAHALLLRALLATRPDLADDAIAAHLAIGLAHGRVAFTELADFRARCFAPAPLSAGELHALLRGREPVHVYDERERGHGRGLVRDGSQLARVVERWLGTRAVYAAGAIPPTPPPPLSGLPHARERPPVVASAPLAPIVEQAPAHPLEPLARALAHRLGALQILPSLVGISPARKAPLLAFTDRLLLGGDHPHARAIHALLAARDPRAAAALDALVAHALTVLNAGLASVTDAAEFAGLARLVGEC